MPRSVTFRGLSYARRMANFDDILEAQRPVALVRAVTVTPSATADTFGTAAVIAPSPGHRTLTDFAALKLVLTGSGEETLTLVLTAVFEDGTSATFTDTGTTSNLIEAGNHGGGQELVNLLSDGQGVSRVSVAVKSSATSSTASYAVTLYGSQA